MAAHVRKRGPDRYQVRFRVDGQEFSKTLPRLSAAREYQREIETQLARGEWVSPADRRVTVAEYVAGWVAVQPWRGSTRVGQVSRLENHVLPTFGDRRLGSVRRSEVQLWVSKLGAPDPEQTKVGLSPATVEGCLRLLASIYKAAIHDRLVTASPTDGVRTARREPALLDPLTVDEVRALAGRMRPELSAAVLVAAQTGLRQGELFGVTEDRVRWLERSLVVDRQLVTEKGGTRFGPTKTPRSVRTVPLAVPTVELLAEQIRVYGIGENGFVFHRGGRPWARSPASRVMRDAGGSGWHALRHHCASMLIARGLSVTAVAAVLGHSPAETLATYAAWFPSEDESIRAAVAGAWEAVDNSRPRSHRGLPD